MNSEEQVPRAAWHWLWGSCGVLLCVSFLSLALGSSNISFDSLFAILGLPNSKNLTSEEKEVVNNIVMHLRLPRVLCAMLVGGGLAMAGVAFQCLFRNPLADPYIIGASSGAALGAAIAVLLTSQILIAGLTAIGVFALFGSLAIVFLVFAIGQAMGNRSALTLLLSGIAISSMANALVSLLLYLHNRDAIATIVTWMMGSFADSNWNQVGFMALATALSLAWIWGASRKLDAYSLGDTTAQSLGLSLKFFQIQILVAASIVTAFSVASAGIIGFVGLIAPQLARFVVGTKHSMLVPLSAILGALLLVLADAIARVAIAPVELPVGIITALLGGPFFLFLLLRSSNSGIVK